VKVLLISPAPPPKPLSGLEKLPPLGLAYLAAVLEKEGVDVKILDNYLFNMSTSFIEHYLLSYKPDIVGITCGTATYQTTMQTARTVKQALPSVPVVVGGPHPTLRPREMLTHEEIDVVVVGEGEYTFRELVLHSSKIENLADVSGLFYRNRKGEIVSAPGRPFIKNLDELPFPARHLLPMESYPNRAEFLDVKPIYSINTSRGCPFGCVFCSVRMIWGRSYRSFSPARIVDEIELLIDKYKAKGIYFREDNFTVDAKRVTGICDEMKRRGIDIQWVCESRVDLVSRELLEKMHKAGCRAMWFGPESGSQRVLNLLKKGITIEQTKKAFDICKKVGIRAGASFMMGIPGERIEEMYQTLELADQIDADWCWFNIYLGIPGSELYEKVVRENLYERIDEDGFAWVRTETFDYSKIREIRRNILVKYYMREPQRILRLFGESFSAGTWRDYVYGIIKMLIPVQWRL
jgi:anaerobic magnesium-protoporphyrin IX monomethyl ester cyclase